ncbi:MAG: hypothetical protein ACJ75B_17875 [Flavisolibacter sp.]
MFNPLAPLDQRAIDGMVTEGHRFFVRQSFPRAKDHFDEGIKGYFLFCHYKDYSKAKEHFDVLKQDPARYLYDWEVVSDRERLMIAASRPAGYKLYTNTFMPDWERHLTNRLREKIRLYIQRLGWKPDREESVNPVFYPWFGEVYVSLRFRKQEVKVKFEEIEKIF